MTIHREDLKKGRFEFKFQITENESYDENYKQDNKAAAELIQQRIDEKHEGMLNRVKKLSLEEQKQLRRLYALTEGQAYKDRSGNSIPYERKKKVIGTRLETLAEYRKRVASIIEQKYNQLKDEATLEVRNLEDKKSYYENENIVNKVELRQVEESFSSNRRNMMKEGLIQMAKADLGREFKDDECDQAFKSFLEKLISYGERSSDYSAERLGPGMYREYTENVEEEKMAFISVRDSLEAVIEKAGTDRYMNNTLKGYRKMLSSLADGNLEVPQNVPIMKVRGKIYDEQGKAAENVKEEEKAPLFAHEPSIQDIGQGAVGDCYLLGTLSALVATEPQIIKDCMKDNGDGTVTVRFYLPSIDVDSEELKYQSKAVYFNVPKTTIGNKGGRNALWVNAYELAYNGYRRQKKIRRDSVDLLATQIGKAEAKELVDEVKRIQEKLNSRLKTLLPDLDMSSYDEFYDSSLLISVEKFIAGKPYKNIYRQILNQQMKEEEEANINADVIKAGKSNEVLEAFSGKLHSYKFLNNTVLIKNMNDLTYVFDNLPGVEQEKAKDEDDAAAKKIARNLARKYLKNFSVEEENRLPVVEEEENKKDKKDGQKKKAKKEKYFRYMTRPQMKVLVKSAKSTYEKGQTINEMLAKLGEADPDYKMLYELQQKDPDVADKIAKSAEKMLLYFFDNADKNTVLNYERFSGEYSDTAKKLFEEVKKAAGTRKVITTSTYHELEALGMERGQSGEPVFEGIASMHAYSILGTKSYFDEDGRELKFIRVRNPWGLMQTVYEKDPVSGEIKTKQVLGDATGGISEIELNHFMERFKQVGITGLDTVRP